MNNFQECLSLILKSEGGYVNHPSDPGGHTNKGITLETMSNYLGRNAIVEELKNISDDMVAAIYELNYWNPCLCYDLPSGVDYAVFDFAVNSGVGRASRFLQKIVHVRADGVIGPKTLKATEAMYPDVVAEVLCDRRLAFMKTLGNWEHFGKGWYRRVVEVKNHAILMVAQENTQ